MHITQNSTLHYTVLYSSNTFLLLTYSRNDNDALLATWHKQGKNRTSYNYLGYERREERGKACPGALAVCSAGPNMETCNYKQKVIMFSF